MNENNADCCDIRGAGESFHVEYVMNEPDGYETQNLTHQAEQSDDDLGEDEISVGWVAESDDPGFAMLHIFEGDDQIVVHRLTPQTLFQLAEMFKLIAMRTKDALLNAEAEELAQQVETRRMYQELPFDSTEEKDER